MTSTASLADQLLDAQVAWILEQLTGPRLPELLERDVDDLLAVAGRIRLDAAVDPTDVTRVVHRVMGTVPACTTATTMVQATADQIHEGPTARVAPADVVDREQVEALVDALMPLRPLVGQALDRMADSPRMGTLASGFVTKLVVDVLEANRSMAQKIPGVGSLVSFGTNAATKVVGVADKQVQSLLGDTAGKGAAFAVRRLNKVVMDTLNDPMMRDAVLEVWDAHAGDAFDGVGDDEGQVGRDDIRTLAGVLQDIVIAAGPSEPALAFAEAWIATFFDIYGEYPIATLLEELEVSRDDLVADAIAIVPPLVAAAHEDGWLEQAIRTRLEPFFASPAVTAILAG